jgi:hypothetical protein
MRTLKAFALSALLLIGSTTVAFASETNITAQATASGTERLNDDGSGCANPTAPSNESDYERWV